MNTNIKAPKVYLVGAGPGNPDLITVKAVKAIAEADVILCDRLVSPGILDNYAHKNTEVIYVGKECSKNASTPQSHINALMIDYACRNKTVVRLKGGDVSVFSNILDELRTLKDNHIPFEIIPGITAASGAAAYAGMPLTARGYATSVRFLTFYTSEILTDHYWKELAATDDTLVFYMSKGNISSLVERMINLGISEEKEIAVIEQATTPYQKVHTSSFNEFNKNFADKNFASPSLIIIGRVVTLHKEFSWVMNSVQEGLYFKSVANGSLISTTQKFFEYAV